MSDVAQNLKVATADLSKGIADYTKAQAGLRFVNQFLYVRVLAPWIFGSRGPSPRFQV